MTSNTFNKIHFAEFLKRSPPHAVGRMTEAWDGGKLPGSWFVAVGYTSHFIAALDAHEAYSIQSPPPLRKANNCVVMTDNDKDFFDFEIVNPIGDDDGGWK